MSLMKRYHEDMADLKRRASEAAREPTTELRRKAITAVLEDCQTAAQVYADPVTVTQLFVSAVVQSFMKTRTQTEYTTTV